MTDHPRPQGRLEEFTELDGNLVVSGWLSFPGRDIESLELRRAQVCVQADYDGRHFRACVSLPVGYAGEPILTYLVVQSAGREHPIALRYDRPLKLPLPPKGLLARAGSDFADPPEFLAVGLHAASEMFLIVAAALPSLQSGAILEWGCGWGRVTRHLLKKVPTFAYHGVDQDPDCVEWLRANMPRGQFDLCAYPSPIALADASQDILLVGESLFALPAEEREFWLEEFHRLLRPGGAVVFATRGEDPEAVRAMWGARWAELAYTGAELGCFADFWLFEPRSSDVDGSRDALLPSERGRIVGARQLFRVDSVVAAAHFGSPHVGETLDGRVVWFRGWVVGMQRPVEAVEITCGEEILCRIAVNGECRDLAESHPEQPWAAHSGLTGGVGLVGLPAHVNLQARAILRDGGVEPLYEFEVQQDPLDCATEGRLTPVLLESMGRMGTTWVMRLLSNHPQIVVDPNYPHEAQPAQHLAHMLSVLSKPANFEGSVTPQNFFESSDHVGRNPFFVDGVIGRWFGRDFNRELAEFCGRSMDGCYRSIATELGKPDPRCFVEKVTTMGGSFMQKVVRLCGQTRELFLVRDLRDVLCSAKAFNEKRGFQNFGEEDAGSFMEFAEVLRKKAGFLQRAWRRQKGNALLVRYEDLLEQPSVQLKRVLEYLGLECDDEIVQAMVAAADASSVAMAGHVTARDPTSSIGRWKSDLESGLQDFFSVSFGGYLREFGYLD